MKKIMYFHGLGGGGLGIREIDYFIEAHGVEFISPKIDYRMFVSNSKIFDMFLELAKDNDIDCVVGNSMGGFFAYHIGKALGIKTMLFNPAISEVTTSYNWFNAVTNYEESENQERTILNLGTHDSVVNHTKTQEFLEKENFGTNEINWMKGKTHTLSYELILLETLNFVLDEKVENL